MRSVVPLILVAMVLASCGRSDGARTRQVPVVTAGIVTNAQFVDRIDAVGTARAREQVTLSAPVTDRIVRLNFQDGAYVRRGQVIAELAQGQENAELAEARARAREADQQLKRLEALKTRGFATNASVDSQVALSSTARAQAAGANASIADRVVRAPFGGYASLRTISAGAVVSAGTPIATISDISQIKLDFPVPETLLSTLAVGQPIRARAAAYPDQPFTGRIATIDPVVDPATRSVMVRAILANPDNRLKPGMLLTVTIESAARMAPAVPELAVVGQGDQRYVFLIGPDNKVKRTPVRVGVHADAMVEIVDGLKPGQKIVRDGIVKVTDGAEIRLAGRSGAVPAKQRER